MYDYHNNLRRRTRRHRRGGRGRFDLKPVWFYQGASRATPRPRSTTPATSYLVAGRAGDGLHHLAGVQAPEPGARARRRSRFAWQWIRGRGSTARRSSTTTTRACRSFPRPGLLPRRAVARRLGGRGCFARLSAAALVLLALRLWLLDRPLCAIVRVDAVDPGSQACPALIPDVTLATARDCHRRDHRRRRAPDAARAAVRCPRKTSRRSSTTSARPVAGAARWRGSGSEAAGPTRR